MTKPTLDPKSGFSRLRVDLTYDGTNFSGWAKQPNLRTVQDEIENALSTITQTQVSTIVAGRTDAGVHAKQQVIHADLPENTNIENPFVHTCLMNMDVYSISKSTDDC